MAQDGSPIPVPLSIRIRHLLTQQLQGWLFALSVVGVIALWFAQRPRVILNGQVEVVSVVVPATRDGVLESVGSPLSRFDRVEQGVTPIAMIDATDALLQMQTLTSRREQLLAELDSQRQRIHQERLQFQWQADQERRQLEQQSLDRRRARLAIRQRVDDLTSDVIGLDAQRRSLQIRTRENQSALNKAKLAIESLIANGQRLDQLIQAKMSPASGRIKIEQDLKLQRQSLQAAEELSSLLKAQTAEVGRQIAEAGTRLAEASKQWATVDTEVDTEHNGRLTAQSKSVATQALGEPEAAALLEPYVKEIAVHDAKIRELANQIASNQIVATATGTISEIHHPAGTFVRSGDPIVTIASDQRRWIVAYLEQRDHALLHPDTSVQICVDGAATYVTSSAIAEIGSHYESVPLPLRNNANVAQWGVPIKVPIPDGVSVTPGQLVELVIQ